jgi:hypothetical protein
MEMLRASLCCKLWRKSVRWSSIYWLYIGHDCYYMLFLGFNELGIIGEAISYHNG